MTAPDEEIRVAVYQCAAAGLEPVQRLELLSRLLAGPKVKDADLLVCPELFMSGYNVGDDLRRLAEPVDGPFAQAVARLARQHRKAILYGYPESAGNPRYNSAACFGRDGKLLGNHRKLVLPPGFESRYFVPGQALTFFTLAKLRLAILVCYEAEFPEAVRAAVIQGAHVILVPTALADCWEVVATRVMPARAFENGVYIVYANHAGSEGEITFLGASCVTGPNGNDIARAGAKEELILASLRLADVSAARARLPYLTDMPGLLRRTRHNPVCPGNGGETCG